MVVYTGNGTVHRYSEPHCYQSSLLVLQNTGSLATCWTTNHAITEWVHEGWQKCVQAAAPQEGGCILLDENANTVMQKLCNTNQGSSERPPDP